MKKYHLILFACLLINTLYGQKIKYSKDMLQKMKQIEIDIFEPTEGKYKSRRSIQNDYQQIDHTILSKKEGIEIRFAILPYRATDFSTQVPHVEFMRLISSIAPNEEEVPITVHNIPKNQLNEKFNADWGSIAYFKPKPKFSNAQHCRVLSLYAEERGMIHVFFLFDEPSEYLDNRLYSLRFKTHL